MVQQYFKDVIDIDAVEAVVLFDNQNNIIGSSATTKYNPTVFSEMQAAGYAVWISGSATKDASTLQFAWGFTGETVYSGCEATESVPDGGTGVTQLTIHGDHLFYESLVDHGAGLRFQALADADVNGDGEVTPTELAAISGTAFQALDHYDVPPGSGIDNLWHYLAAQIATLGHIDGEGHCH